MRSGFVAEGWEGLLEEEEKLQDNGAEEELVEREKLSRFLVEQIANHVKDSMGVYSWRGRKRRREEDDLEQAS